MRSLRQLIRQPLKTLSGILLVGLAVAVLCVSFSQTLAAEDTVNQLKESFITLALPADINSPGAEEWVTQSVTEHPEIFQEKVTFGLASAYFPTLTQDNYTTHLEFWDQMTNNSDYEPDHPVYAGAVLEITVDTIKSDSTAHTRYRVNSDNRGSYVRSILEYPDYPCYSVYIHGTIERVIGLEPGYHDPTGYGVSIYMNVESEEAFQQLDLTAGERYLVYSDSYLDVDWMYRSFMVSTGKILFWEEGVEVPYWRSVQVTEKSQIDWDAYYHAINVNPDDDSIIPDNFRIITKAYRAKLGDLYTNLSGDETYMFKTIEVDVRNFADLLPFEGVQYTYIDRFGVEHTLTREEYRQRYDIPTIVHLEGTAEEFLDSDAGEAWRQALSDIAVNNHAFPVNGVDDLHYFADFACGRAEISQGRHFTDEELASGAKVCILSESLARANGLEVGDTLPAQFMNYDFANPYQERVSDGSGYVYPTAYSYYGKTMSLNAEETYTIVGLYTQDEPWGTPDNNLYCFTPNTIFAPKSAVSGDMDYSNYGQFATYLLDDEKLRDLQLLAVDAGYADAFAYNDNGYTALADSLDGYTQAAREVLPLGLLVYGVLMTLYLLLFPGRQGRELTMMDSMGAPLLPRIRHIALSCAGVVIPGSALGAIAGISLWKYVSEALAGYMDAGVEIILDINQLWTVSGIQAVAVILTAALLGAVMALNTNYMKRK